MEFYKPQKFIDFIGQEEVIKELTVKVQASKNNGNPMPHLLFLGASGGGKTTIANIVANELGVNFVDLFAPDIKSVSNIVSKLIKMDNNDILFIDEIQALSKKLQESLYQMMSNFKTTITTKKESVEVELPQFTLIGATTHAGRLNPPLLRRFEGGHIRLQFYTDKELSVIVRNAYFQLYHQTLDIGIANKVAKLGKKNPATSINLIKSYREVIDSNMCVGCGVEKVLEETIKMKKIDPFLGFDFQSRQYLSILQRYVNKPVGIEIICSIMRESRETVEELVEPFLMDVVEIEGVKEPLVIMTSKGRKITDLGILYLDICRDMKKQGWFLNETF